MPRHSDRNGKPDKGVDPGRGDGKDKEEDEVKEDLDRVTILDLVMQMVHQHLNRERKL